MQSQQIQIIDLDFSFLSIKQLTKKSKACEQMRGEKKEEDEDSPVDLRGIYRHEFTPAVNPADEGM